VHLALSFSHQTFCESPSLSKIQKSRKKSYARSFTTFIEINIHHFFLFVNNDFSYHCQIICEFIFCAYFVRFIY